MAKSKNQPGTRALLEQERLSRLRSNYESWINREAEAFWLDWSAEEDSLRGPNDIGVASVEVSEFGELVVAHQWGGEVDELKEIEDIIKEEVYRFVADDDNALLVLQVTTIPWRDISLPVRSGAMRLGDIVDHVAAEVALRDLMVGVLTWKVEDYEPDFDIPDNEHDEPDYRGYYGG